MSMLLRRAACSLVVLFGSATLLFAQAAPAQPRTGQPRAQPTQRSQPGQPGQFGQPARGGAQTQQLEPSIVTLLIIENNKEIALGQLGKQTSENEHVKHFCEMIIKDHSNFVQKLQERSAAGSRSPGIGAANTSGQGTGLATQPPRPGSPTAAQPRPGAAQPRETTAQPGREATARQDRSERSSEESRTAADQDRTQGEQRITVAKPVIGNQPGSQLLQLHQEIAEQCLEQARRDADKLKGEEFDNEFIGGQIVAHKAMIDKLQVFERHVSPELKQLLADAQQTTKQHLEEAQSIHQQLGKQAIREGAGGTSRRATEAKTERE
jgi:predicted outer membrane protein